MANSDSSCEAGFPTESLRWEECDEVQNGRPVLHDVQAQDEGIQRNSLQSVWAVCPIPTDSSSKLRDCPTRTCSEEADKIENRDEMQDGEEGPILLQMVVAGVHDFGDKESDPTFHDQFGKNRESYSTRDIPAVECKSCKSEVLKHGALNKVICLCGYSFCFSCGEKLPSGFYGEAFSHFCVHERYHLNRPCRECKSCDLYEQSRDLKTDVCEGRNGECKSTEGSTSKRKMKSKIMEGNAYERIIQDTSRTRHERWVSRQKSAPVSWNSSDDEYDRQGQRKEEVQPLTLVEPTTIDEDFARESKQLLASGDEPTAADEKQNLKLTDGEKNEQEQQIDSPVESSSKDNKTYEVQGDELHHTPETELILLSDDSDDDEPTILCCKKREQALQSEGVVQTSSFKVGYPNLLNHRSIGDHSGSDARTSPAICRGGDEIIAELQKKNIWESLLKCVAGGPTWDHPQRDGQDTEDQAIESWIQDFTLTELHSRHAACKRKERDSERVKGYQKQDHVLSKLPSRSRERVETQHRAL